MSNIERNIRRNAERPARKARHKIAKQWKIQHAVETWLIRLTKLGGAREERRAAREEARARAKQVPTG